MNWSLKNSSNKFFSKNSPIYSHCKRSGYTGDKCYKLHGFLPGYCFNQNRNSVNSCVNLVLANHKTKSNVTNETIDHATNLKNEQCHQLITVHSWKMASINDVTHALEKNLGIHYILNLNSGHYSFHIWTLGTRVARYTCNDKCTFRW